MQRFKQLKYGGKNPYLPCYRESILMTLGKKGIFPGLSGGLGNRTSLSCLWPYPCFSA